jgi:hypothetical protein
VLCRRKREGEVGGEWRREEEGAAHRVATDASRPEAVRGRVEPELSPREGDIRVKQNKKQSAVVYVYTASPSSLGQRRLYHHPNVSATPPFCLCTRLRAPECRSRPFTHERPSNMHSPCGNLTTAATPYYRAERLLAKKAEPFLCLLRPEDYLAMRHRAMR